MIILLSLEIWFKSAQYRQNHKVQVETVGTAFDRLWWKFWKFNPKGLATLDASLAFSSSYFLCNGKSHCCLRSFPKEFLKGFRNTLEDRFVRGKKKQESFPKFSRENQTATEMYFRCVFKSIRGHIGRHVFWGDLVISLN